MLLGHDDQILQNLTHSNQALVNQLNHLPNRLSLLTSTHSASYCHFTAPSSSTLCISNKSESHAPDLEPYTRDLDRCRGFLLQCSLVLCQQLSLQSEVHYVMGLLRGRALAWAEAENSNHVVTALSFKCLLNLRQGSRSVADFSVEFRTLVVDTKWNDEAFRGAF